MANQGLFQQYGLDFDPEEELRKRQDANMQRSLGLVNGISRNSGVQGAANTGALLGAGLAGSTLTHQQAQLGDIKDRATKAYDQWNKDNPDSSEEDKGLMFQQILGHAAISGGRPDIGSQALTQSAEALRAKKIQMDNLELLGIKVNKDKFDLDKIQAGEPQNIWVAGEANPNKGFVAKINPLTGEATFKDKSGKEQILPTGRYTTQRPLSEKQLEYNGSTTADSMPDMQDADGMYMAAVRYGAQGWLPGGMGAKSAATRMRIMDWGAKLKKNPDWVPPQWQGSRDQHITYDQALEAANNVNSFKLAGNPTLATRTSQLKALPEQIDALGDLVKGLDFPNNPIAAETKAAYLRQTASGAKREQFQNYLSRRTDIIFELTSALRSRGATDKADAAERDAASNYMSPAAFKGWADAQMAAINAMDKQLHTVTSPNMGGSVPNAPKETAAQRAKRLGF